MPRGGVKGNRGGNGQGVKFQPTPEQRATVQTMAAFGVPQDDIARVVGIGKATLHKHFKEELETGKIKADTKVVQSLYQKAIGEGSQSVTAAIWWTKARMGWKEKSEVDVTHRSDPMRDLLDRIAEDGDDRRRTLN